MRSIPAEMYAYTTPHIYLYVYPYIIDHIETHLYVCMYTRLPVVYEVCGERHIDIYTDACLAAVHMPFMIPGREEGQARWRSFSGGYLARSFRFLAYMHVCTYFSTFIS